MPGTSAVASVEKSFSSAEHYVDSFFFAFVSERARLAPWSSAQPHEPRKVFAFNLLIVRVRFGPIALSASSSSSVNYLALSVPALGTYLTAM